MLACEAQRKPLVCGHENPRRHPDCHESPAALRDLQAVGDRGSRTGSARPGRSAGAIARRWSVPFRSLRSSMAIGRDLCPWCWDIRRPVKLLKSARMCAASRSATTLLVPLSRAAGIARLASPRPGVVRTRIRRQFGGYLALRCASSAPRWRVAQSSSGCVRFR